MSDNRPSTLTGGRPGSGAYAPTTPAPRQRERRTSVLSEFHLNAAIVPDVGGLDNSLQDDLGLAHVHLPEIL